MVQIFEVFNIRRQFLISKKGTSSLNEKFPEEEDDKKPIEKPNEETTIEEQSTLRILLCHEKENAEWEQIGRKWSKALCSLTTVTNKAPSAFI